MPGPIGLWAYPIGSTVAIDQGVGILVWSPIAGGLLSGKYRRGVEPPAGSRHLGEWSELAPGSAELVAYVKPKELAVDR